MDIVLGTVSLGSWPGRAHPPHIPQPELAQWVPLPTHALAGLGGGIPFPLQYLLSSTVGHRSWGLDSKAEMPFWEARLGGVGSLSGKGANF